MSDASNQSRYSNNDSKNQITKNFENEFDDSDEKHSRHYNERSSTNGILDEETVVKNLSNLGRTGDGSKVAYLNLSLPGYGLKDIRCLAKYKELQILDLTYNKLKDLSVLSELQYLLSLSVSHNQIEKLFDFLPPFNLKEASFSFNQIYEIGNLSNYHYLQTLELNNNKISKIEGLEYCVRLKNLNLSHNLITKIEGLDNLPLINLNLRSNQIKRIEGLDTLPFLRNLNLADNLIKSFRGIPEKHEFLEVLNMENNKITKPNEIDYLISLNLLRDLNLHRNPIRELEDYRLSVIFKLPKLMMLDRHKVNPNEKVNSNNIFDPSPEYIASRDHMTNFIFNIIQDHKVKESTLPSIDSPYPILILCGPEGSGTNEISHRLAEEYPGYFDYVASHTTRAPRNFEKDKIDYNFVKMQEFEQDVTQGKFISCNEYFGDWYGIQWDSIETVARQGLACVAQMELESLLSFKQTYFEPRCVLIITLNNSIQEQRLIEKGFTQNECQVAVSRTDWYSEYNRDHPGFFDAVIVTDDLNRGYENLRNLVLSYLGVSSQEKQQQQFIQQDSQLGDTFQRQLSTFQSSRTKTNDDYKRLEDYFSKDIKDLEMPRSESFLPSNTMTGNRSQQSRLSIESLSHMYSQNLRLKFGSAPAQLLTQGSQAEKSLEKRASEIKRQFDLNNIVNSKSQLSQHMSKQAIQGTVSSSSWNKWDDKSKSQVQSAIYDTLNANNNSNDSKEKNKNRKLFNQKSDDSSDEDDSTTKNKLNFNSKKNDRGSLMSRESGGSSNISLDNSMEKFFN